MVTGNDGLGQGWEIQRSSQCVPDRLVEAVELIGRLATGNQPVGIDRQRQLALVAISDIDGLCLRFGHGIVCW